MTTHPQVLATLRAELDAVLPGGRPAEWADLPFLPCTARVLTEALRLRPPGWVLLRTCTRETDLGGRTPAAWQPGAAQLLRGPPQPVDLRGTRPPPTGPARSPGQRSVRVLDP
ncbi:cytochrome P450 [Kitasatospora sp. NPDC054768]